MLLTSNTILADVNDVNGLVNGSFEADKWITDISVKEPNGWDVNMLTDRFGGSVSNEWSTDGNFGLTLFSYILTDFDANDMVTVSQKVSLWDTRRIFFDIKLNTSSGIWDPNKSTAAILIDEKIVWKSDKFGANIIGEHLNQFVDVNFTDYTPHNISLALISDVDVNWFNAYTTYYAYWDNVGLDLYCDGNGFPDGDFNRDCRVDMNDYCMLANIWLQEFELYSIYNLSHEGDIERKGIVNFGDYAIWAPLWEPNSIGQLQEFTAIWLSDVPYDSAWNLYKDDDLPMRGVMNADDLVIFTENWLDGIFE